MLKNLKYIFLLLVTFSVHASDINNSDGTENCESYISIHGSSNINQFQFVNSDPKINDNTSGNHEENHIRISVENFQNSNNRMLKDFYEMLKASEYPNINIVIEPRRKADFDESSGLTNFKTKITIAGTSKSYIVPGEIVSCERSGYLLIGKLELKLTDFEIDPPRKVLGAVKVNNEVFVNFAFRFPYEEILTENAP